MSTVIWLSEWMTGKDPDCFILDDAPISGCALKAGQKALMGEALKAKFIFAALLMKIACFFLSER